MSDNARDIAAGVVVIVVAVVDVDNVVRAFGVAGDETTALGGVLAILACAGGGVFDPTLVACSCCLCVGVAASEARRAVRVASGDSRCCVRCATLITSIGRREEEEGDEENDHSQTKCNAPRLSATNVAAPRSAAAASA